MKRSRAYYRHQRKRVIKRKKRIYLEYWKVESMNFPEGKLDKGKVHCGCLMCKYEKHFNIEKIKDKAKKQSMKKEIDDYLFRNK